MEKRPLNFGTKIKEYLLLKTKAIMTILFGFIGKIKKMGFVKGSLYSAILIFIVLTTFSSFAFSGRTYLNIINNIIYALFILLILFYILLYGSFRFDRFVFLIIAFNFVIIVSSAFSGFAGFKYTTLLLGIFAFFFYQFLISGQNKNDAINAILIGSLGFVLYFTIIYFVPIVTLDYSTRLGLYFDNQNAVARYFVLIYTFFLYYSLVEKKYFCAPIALFSLYLMTMTGSISNIFSSVFITIFMLFYIIPKGKKYIGFISIFAIVLIGTIMLQLDAFIYFRTRINDIINTAFNESSGGGDTSTETRQELVIEAFYLFLKRPLFGYGFDGVAKFSFFGVYAHNNIFELLADYGLFAGIIFESLILLPIERVALLNSKKRVLFISLMLLIFLYQFFMVNYYLKYEYILFAIVYANTYNENDKHISLSLRLKLMLDVKHNLVKKDTQEIDKNI